MVLLIPFLIASVVRLVRRFRAHSFAAAVASLVLIRERDFITTEIEDEDQAEQLAVAA